MKYKIYTYVAKYRNTGTKTGESEIRIYGPQHNPFAYHLNLQFITEYNGRRVDASQFRKSRGTKCVILNADEFQAWLAEHADNKEIISRNQLILKISWDHYDYGPYKVVLRGKRKGYLGEYTGDMSYLLGLCKKPANPEFQDYRILHIIPYLNRPGIAELFQNEN